MTDQEVLTKAIEIAIANGWEQRMFLLEGEKIVTAKHQTKGGSWTWTVTELLFDHDFARALWGEEPDGWMSYSVGANDGKSKSQPLPPWRRHLQQMVIAPNPIEYLKEQMP